MGDILQTNNLSTKTGAKFHRSPETCLEDLGDDLGKKCTRLTKGKGKKEVQILWLEDVSSSPNSANYSVILGKSSSFSFFVCKEK